VPTSSRRRPRRQPPLWLLALIRHVYAGQVARDLSYITDMTDRGLDALEDRVSALEEVIAADDADAPLLRERLRAGLRASVAGYDHMEPDFRRRRCEWMGDTVIAAHRAAAARHRDGA
jgi:hypothetical protein